MTRSVLFAAGTLVCLTAQCGPAQAQTAREARVKAAEAISVLCPRRAAIATAIEAAAERWSVDAVVLTALILVESSCNPKAANKRTGCYGLTGIKVDGSANYLHLGPAQLLDPATNAELGARHLRALIGMCGSLGGALHVYNGGKRCRNWRSGGYARRVLELADWARAMVRRLREARS